MGTIRISQRDMAKHVASFGDSGAGKTQLVTQFLLQIERREETAIIWDPDQVYRRLFFRKDRGDISFDPSLDDCCWWDFGNEPADMGEAKMLAFCQFPDRPGQHDNFFQPAGRDLHAWLHFHKRPTTAQMAHWLAHPEIIDQMVKGTELETILSSNSPAQRAGVIAHIALAAQALGMMPESRQGRTVFSTRKYVEKRRGWIFLSGRAMHEAIMKPIHQMVVASLIQRYIAAGLRKDLPRTYFVVGEASALHVHEFHTALVRLRKTDTPVIYEVQSMKDLEMLHGQHALAIFSNAYNKFFGRQTHPKLAEELRDAIGQHEFERLIESVNYNDRGKAQRSVRIDRIKEWPYTKEDVMNFDDLEGVFLQPKTLVHYHLPVIDLSLRGEKDLKQRDIPAVSGKDFALTAEPLPLPPPAGPPQGQAPKRAPGIPKGKTPGAGKKWQAQVYKMPEPMPEQGKFPDLP